MKQDERTALRRELIVHSPDCVLTREEAAAFLGVGLSWLDESDVPRAPNVAGVKYLKSQLLAYVSAHLTHRIKDAA